MTNERIDVLAEMDNAIERLRYIHYAGNLRVARAAVAELIEAAKEVEQDMHTLDMFTTRLSHAIARVEGAA